jgi:hypothetical protein
MTNVTISETANTVVVVDENTLVVQTTGLGPQGPGGVLGLYGNFIDTTDQPIISGSAAQVVAIGTTLEQRGVTITSGSRITFELAGTYSILGALQITNFGNTTTEVDVFLRKNGTDITNTNTRIDLEQRKSVGVPYHDHVSLEYQITVAANDYIELWWASQSTDVRLEALAATAVHPQAPSVLVNVAQVMYSQAGVPIGGAAGDILVKSSATNYDTAWTDAPTVDKLGLDVAAAETISTGQIAWDAANATPVVRHRPNVIGRLGQDQHCLCKNTSGVSLIKGRVVMFAGADSVSGRIEITPLVADGSLPGYVYFGVTAEAIAAGDFGMVCTFGFIEGIDTSIYPEDSILWACTVNPGAMVLEADLQPAPALHIPTAVVVKSDATTGVIFVRASTGAELRLLHDVYVDYVADGDVLTWIDALNRWEGRAPANNAPRSITIAGPQIGDSFTLFRTTRETTITSAVALVSGGSVTYELRYAADRSTAGTLATVSDAVTNTTTGDSATVQNQPIAASRYVWVEITGVTGTVDEFNLSVAF